MLVRNKEGLQDDLECMDISRVTIKYFLQTK